MTFSDIFKSSFLDRATEFAIVDFVIAMALSFALGLFIFYIYKKTYNGVMYSESFGISLMAMSMITTLVILAVTSNIVLSLGMVGALSIVRFRTAIKNPMDLLFLFWSVGIGIICGAGMFEIAIMVSLITTVGMILLEYMPGNRKMYLLIVNGKKELEEDSILEYAKPLVKKIKVKTRNLKKNGNDYIFEVETKQAKELVVALREVENVEQLSLLQHEGEVRV